MITTFLKQMPLQTHTRKHTHTYLIHSGDSNIRILIMYSEFTIDTTITVNTTPTITANAIIATFVICPLLLLLILLLLLLLALTYNVHREY